MIELLCVEIVRENEMLLFLIGLTILFSPLVIPYNPSSHESLDHVGEEKEVK